MRGVIFTGIALVGLTAALGGLLQQPAAVARNVSHMALGDWLSEVEAFWGEQLQSFKHHAEGRAARPKR